MEIPPTFDPKRCVKPRVKPSLLASAPGWLLAIGLLLSLAGHVGLVMWAYDLPLGYVDPDALDAHRGPVRIKRASYDQILPSQAGLAADEEGPLTASEASLALLEEPTLPLPSAEVDAELKLRDVEETLPDVQAGQLALDLPAFEIDEALLEDVSGRAPAEIDIGAGPGTGGSPNGTEGGTASGSAAARELLRSTGITAGLNPAARPIDEPLVDETPAVHEELLEPSLEGPAIDFVGIALSDTTELVVPEHLDNDFEYRLSRYVARREDDYFEVQIIPQRSLRKLKAMPKDVVFLIDTSSSIPDEWVAQAFRGVRESLPSLNPGDRFNIVLFDEKVSFFSTKGVRPARPDMLDAARSFLKDAKSEGYTDVNAALRQILVRDVDAERVYMLVLISDGKPTRGVIDTRELINLITRDNDLAASIYCVGVGKSQDRELLDFLSYRNKGRSEFVDRLGDCAPVIRDLMSRLRYPLINNVEFRVAGLGGDALYPQVLPNVHQNETLRIYGRYDLAKPFTMRITGLNGGKPVDFTFTRNLADAPEANWELARQWGFWKLHHLYSEIIREGESNELLAEIRALRRKYRLKTLY